jgi:thiol-disulfide isomerase/thioredoxin
MTQLVSKILLILIMALCITSLWANKLGGKMEAEYWRLNLSLQGQNLPFILEHKKNKWILHNQGERIVLATLKSDTHSVELEFPQYSNRIQLTFKGELLDQAEGIWLKQALPKAFEFPISGKQVKYPTRFEMEATKSASQGGPQKFPAKFKLDIQDGDEKSVAQLIAKRPTPGTLAGSILTETGDFRYLEGWWPTKNSWELVGFDGQFAYVLKGSYQEKDQTLMGELWGGAKWHITFQGKADQKFALTDPYSLTKLRPDQKRFHFKGIDLDGKLIDLSIMKRNKKRTLVQIMGSWCPNCLDESVYLRDWMKKHPKLAQDVEIIALAFEKSPDESTAKARLNKWRKHLEIPYSVVLATHNLTEKKVIEILPEIEKHVSFPTLYYLNEAGEVEKIHTGFSGPATGEMMDLI